MSKLKTLAVAMTLLVTFSAVVQAKSPSDWVKIWNQDPGRRTPLDTNTLLFKNSTSSLFPDMTSVGFVQSDGTYIFGKLIWNERAYSPLSGFSKILTDKGFATLGDEERQSVFLELLQQTFGQLGTKPYVGVASKSDDRPQPIVGVRATDGSHRFQVWFVHQAGEREGIEWRKVIFTIAPSGDRVRSTTLQTYHPTIENLKDFPTGSGAASE